MTRLAGSGTAAASPPTTTLYMDSNQGGGVGGGVGGSIPPPDLNSRRLSKGGATDHGSDRFNGYKGSPNGSGGGSTDGGGLSPNETNGTNTLNGLGGGGGGGEGGGEGEGGATASTAAATGGGGGAGAGGGVGPGGGGGGGGGVDLSVDLGAFDTLKVYPLGSGGGSDPLRSGSIRLHRDAITSLCLSNDGSVVASTSKDGSLRITPLNDTTAPGLMMIRGQGTLEGC